MEFNSVFDVKKFFKILIIYFSVCFFLTSCNSDNATSSIETVYNAPTNLVVDRNWNTSSSNTEHILSFDSVENANKYEVTVNEKVIETKDNNVNITKYVTKDKVNTISVRSCFNNNEISSYSDAINISYEAHDVTIGIKYTKLENGLYEASCTDTSNQKITGIVVFPDTVNGIKVDSLSDACLSRPDGTGEFMGYENGRKTYHVTTAINSYTTGVILPNRLTNVGKNAFNGCVKIENIELPSTVTGTLNAFFRCSSLKKISVPDGVTSIGGFEDCASIEVVELPTSVKEIKTKAFKNCANLVEINLNNVKEIDSEAFYGCVNLENVDTSSLETLDYLAFHNTKWLNNFDSDFFVFNDCLYEYLGDSKTLSASSYPKNITSIYKYAFYGNVTLEELELPGTISEVGDIIYECINITDIIFNDNIKKVDGLRLSSCEKMKTITFTDSIDYLAITFPANVTTIKFPSNIEKINSTLPQNVEKVELPNNLKKIVDYQFQYCSQLKEVSISSSVEEIGNKAFYGCSSLENIIIPDSVKLLGEEAFSGCKSLKNIKLSSNLECIKKETFLSCESLTKIIFPDSITRIEENAFKFCKNLSEIQMSKNIEYIGVSCFYYCGLVDLNITNKVFIDKDAFSNNKSLVTATIHVNVEKLDSTFFSCTSLEKVYIYGKVMSLYKTFDLCNSLKELYIPDIDEIYKALSNSSVIETIYFGGSSEKWQSLISASTAQITADLTNTKFYYDCQEEQN